MTTAVPKVKVLRGANEGEDVFWKRIGQEGNKYYEANKVNYRPRDGEKYDVFKARVEREEKAFVAAYEVYQEDYKYKSDYEYHDAIRHGIRDKNGIPTYEMVQDVARDVVSGAYSRRRDERDYPGGVPAMCNDIWKRANHGTGVARLITEADAINFAKGVPSALEKGPCAEAMEDLKWIDWKLAHQNRTPWDPVLNAEYEGVAKALQTYWTFLVELDKAFKRPGVAKAVGGVFHTMLWQHSEEFPPFIQDLIHYINKAFTKYDKVDWRVDPLTRWSYQTQQYLNAAMASAKPTVVA